MFTQSEDIGRKTDDPKRMQWTLPDGPDLKEIIIGYGKYSCRFCSSYFAYSGFHVKKINDYYVKKINDYVSYYEYFFII